jgi:RNA polymerase sigma-B factor
VKELSLRLTRLVDELTAELGRPPTVTELAEAADADEEDVLVALDSSNAYSTRSLDAPLESGGEESLRETLGTEESGYVEVEDASLVSAGLDALDERERRIVEMRFFDEMTQSQIAAELGISQMHVSRLLRRSLALMRGRLDDLAPESR